MRKGRKKVEGAAEQTSDRSVVLLLSDEEREVRETEWKV